MDKVIWKAYTLGSFLEYSSKHCIKSQMKELHVYEKYQKNSVANVTASKENNGIVGYIEENNEIKEKKVKNVLTIVPDSDGGAGVCFYQKNYVISTGHNKVIDISNEKIKKIANNNIFVYEYLAKIITKNFYKTCYGFNKSINIEDFNKTYILLPCLQVKETDDFIWEENGKFYTLAVEYINKLMDKAKELKEQKTIRLYEKEKAKYEKEYIEEKKKVVWKGFELGNLFCWSSRKDLSLKEYNLTNEYEKGYVEVITGSKSDKNQYVFKDDLPNNYPVYNNCLCLNCNGSIGYSFYYKNDIVSPTSSVHILLHKNKNLESIMTELINLYFAKNITKIFTTGCYNRTSCLIDNPKFDREIMMLPCLKVNEKNDYMLGSDNRHYTLATNFISYLYLQGRCNYYQKLIDKYTYQY